MQNLILSKRLTKLLVKENIIKINDYFYTVFMPVQLFHIKDNYVEVEDIKVKQFNYFDITKNGLTCFDLNKGEQKINPENGKWKKEGRINLKIGKFLNLFKPFAIIINSNKQIKDKVIFDKVFNRYCEIINNEIKSIFEDIEPKFAENIHEVYQLETKNWSSCMQVADNINCTQFFDLVPEINCLYVVKNEELYSRVLIYTAYDAKTDEKIEKLYGRVYGTDYEKTKLLNWLQDNNYKDVGQFKNLYIPLSKNAKDFLFFEGAPYLDRFELFDNSNNLLFENPFIKQNLIPLQDSSGNPLEDLVTCEDCMEVNGYINDFITINDRLVCDSCADTYYRCTDCESFVNDNEAIYLSSAYYCESCAENYVECENCECIFAYFEIIETIDGFYCSDCVITCEICKDTRYKSFTTELNYENSTEFICVECENDLVWCEENNTYILKTEKINQ